MKDFFKIIFAARLAENFYSHMEHYKKEQVKTQNYYQSCRLISFLLFCAET